METKTECIFVQLFRWIFAKKHNNNLTAQERLASRQLIKNIMFKQYDFEWVDIRLGVQVQTKPKFKNSSIGTTDHHHHRSNTTCRLPRHLATTVRHLEDFDREVVALKRLWTKAIRQADGDTRRKIGRIFEVVRCSFGMELDLMYEVMAANSPLLKDDAIRTKILEYTWDLHWEIEDAIADGKLRKRNFFQSIALLSLSTKKWKQNNSV